MGAERAPDTQLEPLPAEAPTPGRPASAAPPAVEQVLAMQRAVGNRATAALLAGIVQRTITDASGQALSADEVWNRLKDEPRCKKLVQTYNEQTVRDAIRDLVLDEAHRSKLGGWDTGKTLNAVAARIDQVAAGGGEWQGGEVQAGPPRRPREQWLTDRGFVERGNTLIHGLTTEIRYGFERKYAHVTVNRADLADATPEQATEQQVINASRRRFHISIELSNNANENERYHYDDGQLREVPATNGGQYVLTDIGAAKAEALGAQGPLRPAQ